jgi:hypothetical protein
MSTSLEARSSRLVESWTPVSGRWHPEGMEITEFFNTEDAEITEERDEFSVQHSSE